MIQLDTAAVGYFQKLLAQQGVAGMGIRLRASLAGTVNADCKLEFCEREEVEANDLVIECDGFNLIVDSDSAPFLDATEVCYLADSTGGQLTIKAPKLRAQVPTADASVVERVNYILAAEINPSLASHGGRVSLLELRADGAVVLQFGGGCQGCGMKDVTLKQGVEKTLLARVPELTAVIDATDHAAGTKPYYPGHEH
jgi:Fe/S biogenesis protein NfuA